MRSRNRSVAKHFSRAAHYYAEGAELQRAIAAELVESIRPCEPTRILEIGSGTGFLTALLLERFPKAQIDAVEISLGMVNEAQAMLGAEDRVNLILADVENYSFEYKYDLVVGSSVLQWLRNPRGLTRRLHDHVTKDGTICFAVMVEGTLGELHALRKEIAPEKLPAQRLPSPNEVLSGFRESGFEIICEKVKSYREEFPNARTFIYHIHDLGFTGQNIAEPPKLLNRSELNKLINTYQSRFRSPAGGVYATYSVLYCGGAKSLRAGGV